MKDKYRIVFAPDGEHFINSKVNDYGDPAQAVMEARTHCIINRFVKAKVTNPRTHAVIWDSENEAKNPDSWIGQARARE